MKGCTYETHGIAVRERRTFKWLALTIASVLMVFTAFAGVTQTANAEWVDNMVCGSDLGWNTAYRQSDGYFGFYDGEQLNKYSMLDLYGSTLAWTTYNGTQNPKKMETWFPSGDANSIVKSSKTLKKSSEGVHRAVMCGVADVNVAIGNIFLWVANVFSQIASAFVSKALDPDLICQDPTNTEGETCINLLAVIAGDGSSGSDGGIIGRLYSGMYLGLVVLAIASVGIWAAWTGLAKRKLREALSGIVGAIAVFGIGVALMANPLFLAELPMRVATTVGGCVVMGASGVNCMEPSSTDPKGEPDADTICFVDTSKELDISRYLSLLARSQTCKVWKAFVVEPWAVGQFGTSYENLDLGKGVLSKLDNTNYKQNLKVSMYSSDGTMAGTCGDGNTKYTYNNLGLYQLNLMSDLHACGQQYHQGQTVAGTSNVYSDWVYVADIMSATTSTKQGSSSDDSASGDSTSDNGSKSDNGSDESSSNSGSSDGDISYMWSAWVGQQAQRIALGVMAMLMAFVGGWILITTAVMAMMYLFVGIMLTVFSPLFFLAGIVPGTGRRMFLGWLEQMVSSILKYFACIIWMIVTIELYGSVLGNNSSIGLTFTFCLLVTLTMWCYRGEFVSVIGRANFGGTQFSNKVGQWWNQTGSTAAAGLASTAAVGLVNPGAKPEPLHAVRNKDGKVDVGKTVVGSFKTIANNARDHANVSGEMMKRQLEHTMTMGNGAVATGARAYRLAKRRGDSATMKTATANKSALIGEAGKLRKNLYDAGYTTEQIDGVIRNSDMTNAVSDLTAAYNERIQPTKEGITVIDGIIADRDKARAEIDSQMQQGVAQPENAGSLLMFRDYDGDLQGDLKAWGDYRDASVKLRQLQKDGATEADMAPVKATMDTNLTAAKRISDLRTATRQRIDSDAVSKWNQYASNAGMKTTDSINGVMAQGNQFKQILASEQRRYDRDMRNAKSFTDLQTVQNAIDGQNELIDTKFAGQVNGHLHTTGSATRQTNLLANAVNDRNGDSMADRLRTHGLGQQTGTQSTDYMAMGIQPENQPRGRHAAKKSYGDKFNGDIAKQAQGLGIRTRTYARLQSQGHSADQIKSSVSAAIKAYPHVSRDEALNKYFSEGAGGIGNASTNVDTASLPNPNADTMPMPTLGTDASNDTTMPLPKTGVDDNAPTMRTASASNGDTMPLPQTATNGGSTPLPSPQDDGRNGSMGSQTQSVQTTTVSVNQKTQSMPKPSQVMPSPNTQSVPTPVMPKPQTATNGVSASLPSPQDDGRKEGVQMNPQTQAMQTPAKPMNQQAMPVPTPATPKAQTERVRRLQSMTQRQTDTRMPMNGQQTENAQSDSVAGMVKDAVKTAKVVKAVGEVAGVIPMNPMDIADAVTSVMPTGNGTVPNGSGNNASNAGSKSGTNGTRNSGSNDGNKRRGIHRPPKLK